MIKRLEHLIKSVDIKEFLRFVTVGLMATAIHYSIYYIVERVGININIAYTLGFIISFTFNYLASNFFTFKTKPSISRGLRFGIAHIINFLTQLGLLNLFVYLGLSTTLAPFPVYMISVPLNFIFVRFALTQRRK